MEENTSAPSVRSVGMKYGVISSIIGIVFFLILSISGLNAFDNKWGWVNMVISVIILILAHKNFKDEGDGFMSYGQGVGIGFWVALTGLVIGGLFTFVYANFIDTGVMDLMYQNQYDQMEARGMSDEQIETAVSWTIFDGSYSGID